jgi:hypothetical protein
VSTASDSLGEFNAVLDDFMAKELGPKLDDVIRKFAFVIAENIVVGGEVCSGTPVDTNFARASWVVGLGTEPGPRFKGAQGTKGKQHYATPDLAPQLLEMKAGEVLYLLNYAGYIQFLEWGWSQQAPYGMVAITLESAQLLLDRVVKEAKAA